MSRVGTWITDELVPLVERLRDLEGALRREAIQAVGVPLQLGQVVTQRWGQLLALRADARDLGAARERSLDDGPRGFAVGGQALWKLAAARIEPDAAIRPAGGSLSDARAGAGG